MGDSPFFHPVDGYIYGWEWPNGDWAWWSTLEAALAHPNSLIGPGKLHRRPYMVGNVEEVDDLGMSTEIRLLTHALTEGATDEEAQEHVRLLKEEVRRLNEG